jgi:hypothetical protein
VHWTGIFGDWAAVPDDGPRLGALLIEHVRYAGACGLSAVPCLHDGGPGGRWGYQRHATVHGVRLLLAEASKRGWRAVTVPELARGTI